MKLNALHQLENSETSLHKQRATTKEKPHRFWKKYLENKDCVLKLYSNFSLATQTWQRYQNSDTKVVYLSWNWKQCKIIRWTGI